METASVRAVLFVKDLDKVAAFYVGALALTRLSGDKDHAVLECDGFELVVHQIPKQIADTIVIAQPPIRRIWGAIRLDFPVASVAGSRKLARSTARSTMLHRPGPIPIRIYFSATTPRATNSA